MKTEKTFQQEANEYAHSSIETIKELVDALDNASERERDDAEQAIHEHPLSVEVRTGWHSVGAEDSKPTEYNILLGTGGPASRIIGELDEYGQPTSAAFEYQDWFKPWTKADTTSEENETMLKYAQSFYFGE